MTVYTGPLRARAVPIACALKSQLNVIWIIERAYKGYLVTEK